jgi:hypothetical protein
MLLPTRVLDESGKPTDNWIIVESNTGQTDFKQYDKQWEVEKKVLGDPSWMLRQLSRDMMVA